MKKLIIIVALALSFVAKGADFVVTNTSIGTMGGNAQPCPGLYSGYAGFDAPGTKWGWKIDTNSSIHVISNSAAIGTNVHMTAINRFGTKSYCDGQTVAITNSTATEEWRPAPYYLGTLPPDYRVYFYGFIPVP